MKELIEFLKMAEKQNSLVTIDREYVPTIIEALEKQDEISHFICELKKRYPNLDRIRFRGSQVVYILERLSIESEVNKNEDC